MPGPRARRWLIPLLLALAAAALYWPTLQMPLLYDDLLHIRFVKDRSLLTVWLPAADFGFYRPFVLLPFFIIKGLFGSYPSELLHGLNVFQQALNVALLTSLVYRLWRRWPRAIAAGLLLATYPFAYQAVAFYGNNIYPASAGLQLILLHLYLTAIKAARPRRWWLLTALLYVAGLLSHETLVLFGPLAALLHWAKAGKVPLTDWLETLRRRERPAAELLAPYLWFIAAGAGYALLYQLLPTGGGPDPSQGSTALTPKLLYLIQSLVYPIAWWAHVLPGVSAVAIIAAGVLLTVLGVGWAARRPQNRPPLLLGLGWWALATVLIGVNLPTYYIEHGARLLYLSGVGAVLVWAVVLDGLWGTHPQPLPEGRGVLDAPSPLGEGWGGVSRLLGSVLFVFIVVANGRFVRDRVAAFVAIGRPVDVVASVMADRPADEGVLLVNLPSWQSPPRNTFAAGVEYVTLMGGHLFAEELIVENLGVNRPVLALEVPDLLGDPGYPYGVHDQYDGDVVGLDWAPAGFQVFISSYEPAGIVTRYAGAVYPDADGSEPAATLGPYTLLAAAVRCEAGITRVDLTWQVDPAGDAATRSIFVQLLAGDGTLRDQADGPPLGLAPWRLDLPAGAVIVETRRLGDAGSQLLIGSYDFTSGVRDSAWDASGAPLPDDAFRLTVTPCVGPPMIDGSA